MFSALSQVSKHSVELAEMVVEAEIFPAVLSSLRDPDDYVIKNVATLIREIAKHSPEVRGQGGWGGREGGGECPTKYLNLNLY